MPNRAWAGGKPATKHGAFDRERNAVVFPTINKPVARVKNFHPE
jgi:hypothetical protein